MHVKLIYRNLLVVLLTIFLLTGCSKNNASSIDPAKPELIVFPSPATTTARFLTRNTTAQPATLKVFDSEAKKIAEFKVPTGINNYAVDINNGPKGIYHAVLDFGQTSVTKTFIKK
jgi:Secretion system C-terminal sorting domain